MKNLFLLTIMAGGILFLNGSFKKNFPDKIHEINKVIDSLKTRIEIWYDQAKKELQIYVTGKERIQHAQIYFGDTLIAEFYREQIPSDDTIRIKTSCPMPSKISYRITASNGSMHYIKRNKKTDLLKHGTFIEVGE